MYSSKEAKKIKKIMMESVEATFEESLVDDTLGVTPPGYDDSFVIITGDNDKKLMLVILQDISSK